jgi:hypothetical protein
MHVTQTSETRSQTEQLQPAAPGRRSSRKSILALSLLALAVNGTAAVYTLPSFDIALPDLSGLVAELLPEQAASAAIPDDRVAAVALPSFDIPLPNFSSLAEELPLQEASAPKPDPVVAALKDIQSAQQQHAVALQDNTSSLQQNTALLQQDSIALASLRQSITDEQVDVKKISAQLSTLIAKVDWLQNAIRPEITSSIAKGRARNRLSVLVRKRMARLPKPVGPVSVGGAPLSFPARTSGPEG